jgi:hypothetical protein
MYPGGPTSSPPGDPNDVLFLAVEDDGDGLGCQAAVKYAPGYGDKNISIGTDGRALQTLFLPEGKERQIGLPYSAGQSDHGVGVMLLGDWQTDLDIDCTFPWRYFIEDKAKIGQIDFPCVIESLEVFGDSGQITNLVLSGMQRFKNGRPVQDAPTQMELDLVLTNNAGTYTLSLQLGSYVLASGSRVGNGAVNVADQDGSGLSATATIGYTADIALGAARVVARWCKKYYVHVGVSPLVFPRTPEATVIDPGLSNMLSARVALAAGTYDYLVRAETDTQQEGTNTIAAGSKTIPGRPLPPGVPTLQTPPGNAAGTKIQFTASATPGATYRFYDGLGADLPVNLLVIAATAGAGAGTILVTLPAWGGGDGKRTVAIAAVNGGIEDGFYRQITVDYLAGAVVLPRPNIPGFRFKSAVGRTLTVDVDYSSAGEAEPAATFELLIYNEAGAQVASSSASFTGTDGVKTGTLSATALADGWYTFLVRAISAAGTRSSNADQQGPRWLSTAAPSAPSSVTFTLIG